MLQVIECKCDFQKEPLGIDNRKPAFGWKLESSEPDVLQTGYQVNVAEIDATEKQVWDSSRINGNANTGIAYNGEALKSCTQYKWQVTVWDNQGRKAISEPAYFETAFLDKNDWKAKWITPDLPGLPPEKNANLMLSMLFPSKKLPKMIPCTMLHKEFVLNNEVKRVRVYATAHGNYKLLINGTTLGDRELAPEFSAYQKVLYYQTYDATKLVNKGANAIGAIISDGWYCGHVGVLGSGRQYGDRHALLLQMEIEYIDGKKDVIISDESFVCSNEGPIRYSDIFIGEYHDARKEVHGFGKPGLNKTEWKRVIIEAYGLNELCAYFGEPVRRVQEFTPKKVLTTPKGETVIDLGQNIAGCMKMHVQGSRGAVITLEHSEVLDEKGNFLMNIAGTNKQQRDTFILKGEGIEVFEPVFTYHGFRYVRVTGYSGSIDVSNFTAVVIASDMEKTGTFSTSNDDINQLQSNINWSQLGNMISIPTDCPQREKAGWTGDIQVYGPTAAFNQDVYVFLRRWLQSLRADQYEDGRIPFLSPFLNDYREFIAKLQKTISCAGWSDACVIVPYDLYLRYGDTNILIENYDAMTRWMDYEKSAVESGKWFEQFHYGDWLIPSLTKGLTSSMNSAKATKEFVAAAYYARTTGVMQQIAKILNKPGDAEHYLKQNDLAKSLFKDRFITESGVFKSDFQGMYIMALQFGLIPENLKHKYIDKLVLLIRDNGYRLDTGFLSVPFIMDVLCDNGLSDIAYKILFQEKLPSWLYEVKNGATTIWESWTAITPEGKRRNMSYNHYAFGCIGDWMYRHIGGINLIEPGYKKIKISPHLDCGLKSAKVEYNSVMGKIRSSWEIKDGMAVLEVEIPCNTQAIIELHNVGSEIKSNVPVKVNKGEDAVQVGSGTYSFTYKLSRT